MIFKDFKKFWGILKNFDFTTVPTGAKSMVNNLPKLKIQQFERFLKLFELVWASLSLVFWGSFSTKIMQKIPNSKYLKLAHWGSMRLFELFWGWCFSRDF